MAASMINAIRVSLSVFSSPDKERWPTCRLLEYLKGAEDMARGMLREIADKITILPGTARAHSGAARVPPHLSQERAPYFRLGVTRVYEEATLGRSPEHSSPEGHTSNAQAQRPSKAGIAASKQDKPDDSEKSLFAKRLAALEDVLTRPGRHAARMARALHRAAHEAGGRLIAKDSDELWLDHINRCVDDAAYNGSPEFKRLHTQTLDAG